LKGIKKAKMFYTRSHGGLFKAPTKSEKVQVFARSARCFSPSMLLSLDGLAATPFAPFRAKFFYSSMPEKLCIFLMVVLLVLSRQYRRWITKTEYLSCCSARNTSDWLTNLSLTMIHHWLRIVVTAVRWNQRHPLRECAWVCARMHARVHACIVCAQKQQHAEIKKMDELAW